MQYTSNPSPWLPPKQEWRRLQGNWLNRLLVGLGSLYRLGSNAVELVNSASGLCLEVKRSSTSNGTLMDQWSSGGGTNQQWKFQ